MTLGRLGYGLGGWLRETLDDVGGQIILSQELPLPRRGLVFGSRRVLGVPILDTVAAVLLATVEGRERIDSRMA